MFSRYWGIVGLCLALASGPGFGQSLGTSDYSSQQQTASGSAIQSQESASEQEPSQISSECGDDCQQARDDLTAQQEMARAAWAMFWATAVGVLIGGITLFLVWRTVIYTKNAANSADASVTEAKNATKAANDAVTETRRIGEAQTRAYFLLEKGELLTFEIGKPIKAALHLKNFGSTPAKFVRSRIGQRSRMSMTDLKWSFAAITGHVSTTEVGPGAHSIMVVQGSVALTPDILDAYKTEKMVYAVGAYSRYEDVFGERHSMTIELRLYFDPDGTAYLSATDRHNRSN